jgi:class 3 adenylate cyclase/predicted ATPase
MQCSSCKAELLSGSQFCDECGAPVTVACQFCGSQNRPGAKFCSHCGSKLGAAAAPSEPVATIESAAAHWPERRQLTVMFCDMVGSTALSSQLDAEDFREVLGAYHDCITGIVNRNSGFVARYMGDGALVYFGYPQAHEDDAERGVHAGLEIIEAVRALRPRPDLTLECRIGIATGLVVVGDIVGTGTAQEHGIVGETPNLAARLQTIARPNEVVLDQRTRLLVGNLFECRDIGLVNLKGIAEPVHSWEAIRKTAVESRFEAFHADDHTPVVGREEELAILTRRWARAKTGHGQVVFIVGEPGIGKSRLATNFQESLATEPRATLRWFCSPHRQDSALHPILNYLERMMQFARGETVSAKLNKLEVAFPGRAGPIADSHLVADMLSLPRAEQPLSADLTALRRKEETFEVMLRHIAWQSRQQPLLMVYEDAHWSDPTSLELLNLIVARVVRFPILLLVTFRPEFQPAAWSGLAHATTVTLNRLDRNESRSLIRRIVTNRPLPEKVIAEILERTEGVPLFIEELTKTVLEVAGQEASTLPIPSSLQASLLARLDRLPAAKQVAQVGAVIGREFGYELLAAVAMLTEAILAQGLDELVPTGLALRRGDPPDATYVFKHVLVQETAYGTLLRRRRQELHARIAAALEERSPETIEQQPELLAHHYAHAGMTEKAIQYFGRAGQRSLARSAMIEAIAQLRKGLDLLVTLPDEPARWRLELDLQSTLGAALVAAKGNSATETGAAYIRARELCGMLGDSGSLVPVLSGLSTYHQTRSDYQAMRSVAEELIALGQHQGDNAALLVGNRSMGLCQHQLGNFELARNHFQHVVDLYDPNSHNSLTSIAAFDMRSVALTYLSLENFILGEEQQAKAVSARAVAWSRQQNHPHNLAFTLTYAALLQKLDRRDASADGLLPELIALTREHEFPAYLAVANILQGHTMSECGKVKDGLDLIRSGLADCAKAGASWNQTFFLCLLGQSCERAGFVDEAFESVNRALQEADRTSERWFEAELLRVKGEWLIAHRHDDAMTAEICFARAIETARHQGAKLWELRAVTSLARLRLDQGSWQEARDLLAPVCACFGAGSESEDLKEARRVIAAAEVDRERA